MSKQRLTIDVVEKHSTDKDPISQEMVEKCLAIAVEAHKGQRDRDGNAVILHPLVVGSMGTTDAEKCVGFLHDVVEDTNWTFEDLQKQGVAQEIIDALKLCTHDDDLDYDAYIQRIIDSGNMTAIHVKLNDLHHNLARGKAFGYPKLIAKHEKALSKIEASLL